MKVYFWALRLHRALWVQSALADFPLVNVHKYLDAMTKKIPYKIYYFYCPPCHCPLKSWVIDRGKSARADSMRSVRYG